MPAKDGDESSFSLEGGKTYLIYAPKELAQTAFYAPLVAKTNAIIVCARASARKTQDQLGDAGAGKDELQRMFFIDLASGFLGIPHGDDPAANEAYIPAMQMDSELQTQASRAIRQSSAKAIVVDSLSAIARNKPDAKGTVSGLVSCAHINKSALVFIVEADAVDKKAEDIVKAFCEVTMEVRAESDKVAFYVKGKKVLSASAPTGAKKPAYKLERIKMSRE